MVPRHLIKNRLFTLATGIFLLVATGLHAQNTWYATYERALEHVAAGRWQEAADNLESCIRLKPESELNALTYGVWRQNYVPHYYLGLAWYNLGDYEKAEVQFNSSLQAGVVAQIPKLYKSLEIYLEAIRERRNVRSQEQRNIEALEAEIAQTLELEEKGDLQAARLGLEGILAREPDNEKVRVHLGRIFEKIEQEHLLELRDTADSLLAAGRQALERGNLDEAMDLAGQALRKIPGDPDATDFSLEIEKQLQQRFKEDDLLQQRVDSLLRIGRQHLEKNRLAKAHTELQKALALNPASDRAHRLNSRVDSLLTLRDRIAGQKELLREAASFLDQDSLIHARDILMRAREMGASSLADSLMNLVEQRFAEWERISRERDISQLELNIAPDSVQRVREPEFVLRGHVFDLDGLSRIAITINSLERRIFLSGPGDSTRLRYSFAEPLSLIEGLNRIEVVVYDKLNNSVTETCTVDYFPPFWRSPAFLISWVLLIIFSGGGYYYYRRNAMRQFLDRFRRRPFELIQPNPFIVGNPIRSSEMFFGREDDFRFVRNKIDIEQYGSLIVLFGERRAGKTSVLYQILGGRLGPRYLPVFIDMQAMAVNDDWEFLGRIAELTAKAAKCYPFSFDLSGFEDRSRNPYTTFERFIDKLLETIGQDKLLFLVDEYELIDNKVVEGKISKDIFLFLSGLVEHKAGLFLVFAGTHRLQEREQTYWQNLLQRCDYRNISYLTPNDTRRLIQEPVEGQVFYLGSSVNRIMRLTAGQPFYTQLFCRNVVEFLNEECRNYFYEDDVAAIVREIVDNPPPQMIYFWAGLGMEDKLILSAAAEHCRNSESFAQLNDLTELLRKNSSPVSPDSAKKAAEKLVSREILEFNGQERIRFRMDLFRHWVREEHNLYKVLRELQQGMIV